MKCMFLDDEQKEGFHHVVTAASAAASATATTSEQRKTVMEEAFRSFEASGSDVEAECKALFVADDHVLLYVNHAFLTNIYVLRKKAGGEGWNAQSEPGDGVDMSVRDERHIRSQGWFEVN
jgi:hypothetical protein